jgi:hypothetical protein
MWTRRRIRPVSLALAAAAAVSWSAAAFCPAATAGASPGARARRVVLELENQTQWVVPPRSGTAAAFDLTLSASNAPAGTEVSVALYARLDARDHFEDAVEHGPRGYPISETSPVKLSSLTTARPPGSLELPLQVVTASSTGDGARLGLGCAPPTGTGLCTGVYPVEVHLLDPSGKVLRSQFTTFLTYTAGASATPLEFAWVVPVAAPVPVSTPPADPAKAPDPARALGPIGGGGTVAEETLVAQLHAAAVPVTVEASPATLQRLSESGGHDGRLAVATLAAMSSDQAADEFPAAPFVPVDLAQLAGAGEATEIVAQMSAGATVLRKLHVQTSPSIWVTPAAVGDDLGTGLARIGAREVVVPGSQLANTPTAPPETWAATFGLALGKGTTVQAAETDTWLDGQFRAARTDPALAATQILADLAMVHFERPDTPSVRGMIAVPPAGWLPNATFDRVLLEGLEENPDVTAVTLSKFFTTVSSAGTRSLSRTGTGPALPAYLARRISSARVRLSEFQTAVSGKPAVLSQLDHLLLASESEDLTHRRQSAAVGVFDRVFSGQLGLVSFADEGTFTLTARTGLIPITVVSRASYTVVGTLTVSGAKFIFPGRATHTTHDMVLDHATNPWRVDVTARSPGDLPLHVAFTSASGQLVFAESNLRVRSTATSLVGIALTALALVVLLAWWGRTWLSGRRRRARAPGQTPS